MKRISYVYKANSSAGEMLLANDSSSFTRPYFEAAESALKKQNALRLSPSCVYAPSEGCEDPVMAFKREAFRLSEWLLLALIIDEEDRLSSVLLLERAHQEHCLVYSFLKQEVLLCSVLGVEILEEEGEKMSSKEFLSTLSLPLETPAFHPVSRVKPVNLGYREESDESLEEEEDFAPISFVRPDFVPTSKKGSPMNLGSSPRSYEVEDEDEETLHIVVEKEAFAPSKSKKPRNLGSIYEEKPVSKPLRASMEDEDEPEVQIDVSASKAAFCPRQNKKPMNLGSAFDRPAKPRKAMGNDLSGTFVMPTFEKTFEPGNNGKPRDLSIRRKAKPVQQVPASAEAQETLSEEVTIDVKKPDFVPNVKLNATPKQVSFEKPDRPNQKRYASASETLQKPKSETKDKQEDPVCLFRASPDVFESRTILNDPSLHFVHSVFEARWRRILTTPEGLLKSPRSFYLGTDEKDPAIANFSPDEWNILAANVDGDNEPYAYLLSSKSERGCCMAVLRKEKSLVLLCLSRKGIGTENPPHSYEEVLSICLGKQE